MAIFGSEFTVIMLLSGDNASLVQLEMQLPPMAMQLNLLTMMKRTTRHEGTSKPVYLLAVDGPDQTGTIQKLTSYLASCDIDVTSLKSGTKLNEGQEWQHAEIEIELSEQMDMEKLLAGLDRECNKLSINFTLNPITIDSL
jgi:glycine cleavage system transcriptional repressor